MIQTNKRYTKKELWDIYKGVKPICGNKNYKYMVFHDEELNVTYQIPIASDLIRYHLINVIEDLFNPQFKVKCTIGKHKYSSTYIMKNRERLNESLEKTRKEFAREDSLYRVISIEELDDNDDRRVTPPYMDKFNEAGIFIIEE